MNRNLYYLKGMIEGFKEVMDINKRCGIYNVSNSRLIEDKAYLKGLEDAHEAMSRK